MSELYVDPVGGLAGDMLLAALVDAGAPEAELRERLASLPLAGYTLTIEPEVRRAFRGRRARIRVEEADAAHRTRADIAEVLERSSIGERALARAGAVFDRLAEAEAAVHGEAVDAVHFHEVGAIDAIVDIAAIAIALDLLEVDRLWVGTVPLGSGTIESAHGEIPLPSPATARLLEGWPVRLTGRRWEHTTPTGAAVVAALGRPAPPPGRRVLGASGIGFGRFLNEDGPPNMTRVIRLLAAHDAAQVELVEATLDDMSPEHVGYLLERLALAGALDVWVSAVSMKKQRPGVLVSALGARGSADRLVDVFFTHSTTLGVRVREEQRLELPRSVESIETPFGPLRVKVAARSDGVTTAAPEFEDARRVALERDLPIAEVYHVVEDLWRRDRGR